MSVVTEPISFTTTTDTSYTISLTNTNLIPKGFVGVVSKDGTDIKSSIGFSNVDKNKSLASASGTTNKTDIDGSVSLLAYENNVLKVKGTVSSMSTTGEISFAFSTMTAGWTIAGLVIGEQ